MRSQVPVVNQRRILCVFPAYTPSFGTFAHAYPLMGGVKAFMPPQGLLLIAAYLPESWPVRFIDENIAPATAADFAWADAVFVSGMHVQAAQIQDIRTRAQAAGRIAVLGGPSVSGAPEWYDDFDYLHIGEMGDATDRLIALLNSGLPIAIGVLLLVLNWFFHKIYWTEHISKFHKRRRRLLGVAAGGLISATGTWPKTSS